VTQQRQLAAMVDLLDGSTVDALLGLRSPVISGYGKSGSSAAPY
jgi:hypothetical protein